MNDKSLFFPYTLDNIHPGFSVDCVILSFHKKKLKVLLNRFDISNYWQLPGGFMYKNENSDEAARRVLTDCTGLSGVYLRQFHLFSDPERTKMNQNWEYIKTDAKRNGTAGNSECWFLQRFVSLGYFAFVKYDRVKLSSTKKDFSKWFDLDNFPELYSDHENIIKTTIETINTLLPIIPVGYELLPEKFTMGELKKVYECISGKVYDRRNFQRKIMSLGIVVQLDEVKNSGRRNPAVLYSFEEGKKDLGDRSFF
jgi:hypothetical protein